MFSFVCNSVGRSCNVFFNGIFVEEVCKSLVQYFLLLKHSYTLHMQIINNLIYVSFNFLTHEQTN